MATTLIDFEDRTDGDFVVNQYQSKGVIFPTGGSIATRPAAPHSGKNYFRVYKTEFAEAPPVTLKFTRSQKRVKLFAGGDVRATSIMGEFFALDSFGNLLARDGPRPIQPFACNTAFEVVDLAGAISTTILFAAAFGQPSDPPFHPDLDVDDIEFEPLELISPPPNQHWAIVFGIVAGSEGVRWGPHGPEPFPPRGPYIQASPETVTVIASMLSSEAAGLAANRAAADRIRRAALESAASEIDKQIKSLKAPRADAPSSQPRRATRRGR